MPPGRHGSHEGAVAHHAADRASRETRKPDAHVVGPAHPRKAPHTRLGRTIGVVEQELHEIVTLGGQNERQVATVDVTREAIEGTVRTRALRIIDHLLRATWQMVDAHLETGGLRIRLELHGDTRGAGRHLTIESRMPCLTASDGLELRGGEPLRTDPALVLRGLRTHAAVQQPLCGNAHEELPEPLVPHLVQIHVTLSCSTSRAMRCSHCGRCGWVQATRSGA